MWFFSSRKTLRPQPARRVSLSRKPRLEPLEDRCLMSAGALDPTFGNGAGYVTTALNSYNDYGRVALIQPDGKIVATGGALTSTNQNFGVGRYNLDGSLDTSFGSGGTAQASFGANYAYDWGAALYPQAGTANDGKIVMAGSYFVSGKKKGSGHTEFALARFNTNGTLDGGFGNQGEVLTSFSVGTTGAGSVVVGSDGKIVAAGDNGAAFELARYNANGSLDTTFGSQGEVVTSFAQFPRVRQTALVQQPDGKLIVVGDTGGSPQTDWLLARYNANGALDTSFGNQGIVTTPFGGSGDEVAVLYPNAGTPNDGKTVVVNGWNLARYNPNGSLDTTFGTAGEVSTQISGFSRGVALDPNGRIVIAGQDAGATQTKLARVNLDGTPDTTFGSGGLVTTTFGSGSAGWGVAVYPNAGTANDGKIVVVGTSSNGTKHNFLVARYLPSEPEIGSFTSSASTVTNASSVTLTAANITDGNPNSTITQVTFYYYDSNGKKVTLGTGTQTSPGVWALNYRVNLASGTYMIGAQAEDIYGVFGDPFALTLAVQ